MHRKISLVLGSGGARGITQIGIIRFLQQQEYQIDEIVGCSIGSLVGAAFASGKIEELGDWMCKLTKREVFRLMDFSDPRFGFLKGEKVLTTLQDIFDDVNIEDLPIKYTAVATDLVHEREQVFREGSVYKAIRASIAIPAVFKGVYEEDRFLVDGGVLNPVPVNHVQNKNNIIVAINLEGTPDRQMLRNYNKMNAIELLQESYAVMRRRLSSLVVQLHQPDYLIDIPHNLSGIWDFDRSSDLIQQGYEIAQQVLSTAPLEKRSEITV